MGFKSVVCKLELEMNHTVYAFLAIIIIIIIIIIKFSPFLVIVFFSDYLSKNAIDLENSFFFF